MTEQETPRIRSVTYTAQFRGDFKRVKKGVHRDHIEESLRTLVELLKTDAVLPERMVDHQLKGQYQEYRECHIRGDLLLIYRKLGSEKLELVRIGSHARLSL